ncbi:MAG: FecR family protein [Treponema sp.]|nr:FecR family protein [Treponema sp.]
MKRLAIVLIIFLMAASLFAQNQSAVIKELTGTVELKAPGAANWTAARVGDRVGNATIISTGFKSTALLDTGSSTIMVRSLTNLSLENIINMENTEATTNLELRTGRVRVDVAPPSGSRVNFNVQTPSSTASVRGTNFEMDFMNLRVNEGTVRFSSAAGGQPVIVIGGQSSFVDSETGKAVNSFDAGDSNRALPPLPGQGSMPGALRPLGEGFFVTDMTLESK